MALGPNSVAAHSHRNVFWRWPNFSGATGKIGDFQPCSADMCEWPRLTSRYERLTRISHMWVTNVFCDISLLHRITLRCVDVLSSTGFSLCSVDEPQLKPHRLKPVLRNRGIKKSGKVVARKWRRAILLSDAVRRFYFAPINCFRFQQVWKIRQKGL